MKSEVHNILTYNSLGSLQGHNWILHRLRLRVTYVNKGNRVCLVADDFKGDRINEGILFAASSPMPANPSVHLMLYPCPSESTNLKGLYYNIQRQDNIDNITNYLQDADSWVPASFWKGDGCVEVRPPSDSVVTFKPSHKKFEPMMGVEDFILEGIPDKWGHLAHDITHEDYTKMVI